MARENVRMYVGWLLAAVAAMLIFYMVTATVSVDNHMFGGHNSALVEDAEAFYDNGPCGNGYAIYHTHWSQYTGTWYDYTYVYWSYASSYYYQEYWWWSSYAGWNYDGWDWAYHCHGGL